MVRIADLTGVWLRRLARQALAVVLLMSGPSLALAEDITPSPNVQSQVVVRARPMGAPARRIGVLQKGQRAELIQSVRYYYKVRLPNGREGFVAKRWTDEVGPLSRSAALTAGGGTLVLHFIDVGQGDATLVECPNGSTLLIDSGSTSGQDPDEVQEYVNTVLERGGGDLDYLIVSHPDADHYNLLEDVLNDVRVRRAWYVGRSKDYTDKGLFEWLGSTPEQRVVMGPEDHDPQATPNATINCGAAKVWLLAGAVEASKSYKNAMSIVVMIRYGDFEAVITGDATHDTEDVILERYAKTWLDVDLLRVGHHGSLATSTSKSWADTLTPEVAIFSAGYANSYGHPRGEVVDRLAPFAGATPSHEFRSATPNEDDTGPKYNFVTAPVTKAIYATASSGTITVTSTGTGYMLKTERQ